MNTRTVSPLVATAIYCALTFTFAGGFSDCDNTSVGFTPINDLGPGLYLGQFEGGLYPGGVNVPPQTHLNEGLARANAIEPLDAQGNPDPNGRYVLMSIGMSNTTQEFSAFIDQAASSPEVNHNELVIVDGAQGGRPAADWLSPDDDTYNVAAQRLQQQGVTESQVVAIWIKQANPGPTRSLPDQNADAYRLMEFLGDIARAAKVRYPNLQMILTSSRIYAGYASGQLNPEPYAYESAFSAKWLIEAQINQMNGNGTDPRAGDLNYNDGTAPWIGWSGYLWADGLVPRSDGLIWECENFQDDGTHPSTSGRVKVAGLLMDFFLASDLSTPWFAGEGGGGPGDIAEVIDFEIVVGTLVSGGVPQLLQSDNTYVRTRSGFGNNFAEAHLLRMFVSAHTDVDPATSIDLTLEARISEPSGRASLRLRNWQTNRFDPIGTYAIGMQEVIVTFENLDAGLYVQGDGTIEVSISHVVFVPFLAFQFNSGIDWVEVVVR